MPIRTLSLSVLVFCVAVIPARAADTLYSADFQTFALGSLPPGWKDLVDFRPSRNWAVDGKGFLRVMLKEYLGEAGSRERARRLKYQETYGLKYSSGILVYEGALADRSNSFELADVRAVAAFKKTDDPDVAFGVILRLADRDNYYEARFSGGTKLEIAKIRGGKRKELGGLAASSRIPAGTVWTLEFSARGDLLTARVLDADKAEQARADARDSEFAAGRAGLTATTFAAAKNFSLLSDRPFAAKLTPEKIAAANASRQEAAYPVVRAVLEPEKLNTPFSKIAGEYDVVVAGAGTGGLGAALQAARMGARVLLLEETDLIGGQMSNAAVTSMDEGGIWAKNPVRERGIYREFHESAVNHYYTLDKDPFTAYHFNRQSEGGYEPAVARNVLYGLIEETRGRPPVNGRQPVLDLAVRTKVSKVQKSGETVTGVTLQEWTEGGMKQKDVRCRILIDATEYGDVIPLTGVRYRVGTATSDMPDASAPIQDHTWVGVIREYPGGIPEELKIKSPPPGYEEIRKRFKSYQLYGYVPVGGKEDKGKKPRMWWWYVAWRGMPDSLSPATGQMTEERHTMCGLNGGNDYPVTAGTVEDFNRRKQNELEGINRTLGIIYWFQNELGLPWSVADDQGYFSPFSLARMKERGVRDDLLPVAARLPQWPYVREARRIVGVQTLRAEDLYTRDRGEDAAKHWAATIAINDYSFDLHGTNEAIEKDLDAPDYMNYNATGPFPVPYGVFIPEKVDGFLPAEKNFSQSRVVNGATRLQPSTMLCGQAAGAIAALAAQKNTQPRKLNIIDVQSALLASGDTLLSRWYADVPCGIPLWQATQLLGLYGMMDRPGPMLQVGPLGEQAFWGAGEAVTPAEQQAVLKQMAKIVPNNQAVLQDLSGRFENRAELALRAADVLRKHGKSLVSDPAPYAPPHDFARAAKAAQKKKDKLKAQTESP